MKDIKDNGVNYRSIYTYLDEGNIAEDGNCYVKCLQEVYKWFGKNLTSSKIVGIIDTVSLTYENKDLCQVVSYENWDNLEDVVAYEEKCQFSELNKGIEYLKEALEENKIIILSVNTYYLDYTDDYKKVSGGFFKTGHSLIVHGFDDARSEFLISDPTFRRMNSYISYEMLGLAWTYTEESDTFVPLNASIFGRSENQDYVTIMKKALVNSMDLFFEANMNNSDDFTWKNVRCINHVVNILNEIIEKKAVTENLTIIDNIAYSIHHYIRWARKSFGEFIDSDEFNSLPITEENKAFWKSTFDSWSAIGMGIYKVVYTSNYSKLVEVRDKIIMQVTEEIVKMVELKSLLRDNELLSSKDS